MATQFTTAYTFRFAALLCVVLSLLVASASIGLRPLQEVNERRDLQQNILLALGLPEDPDVRLRGEAIDVLYEERVEVVVIDSDGNLQPDLTLDDVVHERAEARTERRPATIHAVYQRRDPGDRIGAYAIPMTGQGLWGPISGYLAVAPDGETVSGATFFAPQETPGLGYEITSDSFIRQWLGKSIHDGERFVPIDVVRSAQDLCPDRIEHCVDGVSGSTITNRGVDAMVEQAVGVYEPFLQQIRERGGT